VQCVRVGLRSQDWSADACDAEALEFSGEVFAVDGVAVVDQVAWLIAPRGGVDELLPDPGFGRTWGHVEMDNLPPGMGDEEEHVESAEAERPDDKKVSCPDALQLVGEEGAPALTSAPGLALRQR